MGLARVADRSPALSMGSDDDVWSPSSPPSPWGRQPRLRIDALEGIELEREQAIYTYNAQAPPPANACGNVGVVP